MAHDPTQWGQGSGHPGPPPQPNPTRFGYPPPPAWGAPPQGFPPPRPAKRPPKRLWVVLSAAVLVLGIAVVVAGVVAIAGVFGQRPGEADRFASGATVTVPFAAGETKVLFADVGGAQGHSVNCNVAARQGDSVRLERYDGSLSLNDWEAVFTVTASAAGDHRITCTGQPGDTFGVGGDAHVGGFLGGLFGVFAGVGVAAVGLVGLLVALVLRHRRRG